jgi:hypothetical protein
VWQQQRPGRRAEGLRYEYDNVFCKNVADVVNKAAAPVAPVTNPTDALKQEKTVITKALAEGEAALSNTPSAIRPDAMIVLTALDSLYKALTAANYDYTKIDPTAVASLDSPAFKTAEAHLEAYVKTTCGISMGTG